MRFLKLYLKPCDKIPRDAVSHLGFRVRNGVIYHLIKRQDGVQIVSARCDECLFYKLMTRSYVFSVPMFVDGKLRVIVADNSAIQKLLTQHASQVARVEPLRSAHITFTKKQREMLSALANGHNISSAAREYAVSKVQYIRSLKIHFVK